MTGVAVARFNCGAIVERETDSICGAELEVELFNDGQYVNYVEPHDWHIALGTQLQPDGTVPDTVVRCPQHCHWTKRDEFGHPLPGGKWRDDV